MDDGSARCMVVVESFEVAAALHRGGRSFDSLALARRCGGLHPFVSLERSDNRTLYWTVPLVQIDSLTAALQRARALAVERYGEGILLERRPSREEMARAHALCPHRGRR